MTDREERPSAGHLGENDGVDDISGSSCLGRLKIFHPGLRRGTEYVQKKEERMQGEVGRRRRDRERRLPTNSVEM